MVKAVLLAAGVGSRIRPLTDNSPKSLLDVAGKSILQRMLENVEAVGITDVIVITGYLEEQLKDFITKNVELKNPLKNKKGLNLSYTGFLGERGYSYTT